MALAASLAQAEYSSLIKRSPFLPPENTIQIPPERAKDAEVNFFILKGFSQVGDSYSFAVLDKRTNQVVWIDAGEEINGFSVLSFDSDSLIITYSWNNFSGITKLGEENYSKATHSHQSVSQPSNSQHVNNLRKSQYAAASRLNNMASNQQARPTAMLASKPLPSSSSSADTGILYFSSSAALSGLNAKTIATTNDSTQQSRSLNHNNNIRTDLPFALEEGKLQNTLAQERQNSSSEVSSSIPTGPRPRRNTVENPNGKIPDHIKYSGLM